MHLTFQLHLGLAAGLALAALTSVFLPASGAHVSPAVCGKKYFNFFLQIVASSGLPGSSPPSPHLTTASSCHGNRAMWGGNCRCGSRPGHHWHCQGPLPGAAEDGHLPRVHAQLSCRAGPVGGRGRAGTRLDSLISISSHHFRSIETIFRFDDRVGLCSRAHSLPRSSQPSSCPGTCFCGQQVDFLFCHQTVKLFQVELALGALGWSVAWRCLCCSLLSCPPIPCG